MDPDEMRSTSPGARFVTTALLPYHRRDFTRYSKRRGGGVADVVSDRGSEVWGVLYELPDDDWTALDRKEGVMVGAYRRDQVVVRGADGADQNAVTYEGGGSPATGSTNS